MNKDYWEEYYKEHHSKHHSLFAEFCLPFMLEKDTIVDLGCGDGRDSRLFERKGFPVIGIDQSTAAIEYCNWQKFYDESIYIQKSFLELFEVDETFNYAYLRFILHAITETERHALLKWIGKYIHTNGRIFIETRTTLDTEVFNTDHQRTFFTYQDIENELIDLGFSILYKENARNFAPTDTEDPLILRLVGELR